MIHFLVSMMVAGPLVHAAAETGRPVAPHTSLWAIVVSIGVVLGVLAAIQQLSTWVRRRPYRKAEERLLQVAAKTLDAEEAKRAFETYRTLGATLRRQVEDEVPREARRVFLRSRHDLLRNLLRTHIAEYDEVEHELAALEERPPTALDQRLRGVIEQSIRPSYLRRRRTERAALALLALLVLLAVSPWSIDSLIGAYVSLMGDPTSWSDRDVVVAVSAGIAISAILGFVGAAWLRSRRSTPLRQPRVLVPAAIALAGCVVALAIGLFARQGSQLASSDYGLAPFGSEAEQTYLNKAETKANEASVLLSASTPIVGLLVGALVAASWPAGVTSRRRVGLP